MSKKESGESGREVVYWVIELLAEVKIFKRGWEVVHWVVEVISKRKKGESRREIVDRMVK